MDIKFWWLNNPFDSSSIFLIAFTFFLTVFNTCVGPSGGMLFAVMANCLPPTAVVPIHAVVQSGASVFRLSVLHQSIDKKLVWQFLAGGTIGFLAGAILFQRLRLPPHVLEFILGFFILFNVLRTLSPNKAQSKFGITLVGLVTSFMTLFVGATGPLVGTAVSRHLIEHRAVMATHTACMVFQNTAKIAFFGFLGFSFYSYGLLLITFLVATALGTWIGKRFLNSLKSDWLKRVFLMTSSALGINLIISSILTSEQNIGSAQGVFVILILCFLASIAGFQIRHLHSHYRNPFLHILGNRELSRFRRNVKGQVLRFLNGYQKSTRAALTVIALLFLAPLLRYAGAHWSNSTPSFVHAEEARADSPVLDRIDVLLEAALLDIVDLRLTKPAGNNALYRFGLVLDLDPQNEDAFKGLDALSSKYESMSRASELAGKQRRADIYRSRANHVRDHTEYRQTAIDSHHGSLPPPLQ